MNRVNFLVPSKQVWENPISFGFQSIIQKLCLHHFRNRIWRQEISRKDFLAPKYTHKRRKPFLLSVGCV